MNTKLRKRLAGAANSKRIRCRFDLDTRFYGTRLSLCFGLALLSMLAIVFGDLPFLVMLPLFGFIGLAAWGAYVAHQRLQLRQPIIAVGRRGIWDRRLSTGVIPWTDIVQVRTDPQGNIILDPWKEFSGLDTVELPRWKEFLSRFDVAMKPGSIRISLVDIDAESWDVLAAIEASLPYYLRSLWRPEPTRRKPVRQARAVFTGLSAATAVVVLFLVVAVPDKDGVAVLHSMGPVTDVGIAPNQPEDHSIDVYRHAAERGDADARMRLGLMFYEGEEVQRDHGEAARWFRLAANDDVPAGQAALGYLHEQGLGVTQDFGQALTWYRRAAEEKHPWAQYRLGMMYRDGRGVTRNSDEAVRLLTAAAKQGDVAGRFHLGEMYENGWGVAQNAAAASEWYRKAAEQNYERAEYNLAVLYRDGRGVPKDPAQAAYWFERSALKGYAQSQYALGLAYEVGRGVDSDRGRANLWYSLAELHGHSEAVNRRKQLMAALDAATRKKVEEFRREWLRRNLLNGETDKRFHEYRQKSGPKAFAVAMNGAWAQTESAKHARDAVHLVMKRCRQYARVCMLYAVGDSMVVGLPESQIDAVISKQLKKTAANTPK